MNFLKRFAEVFALAMAFAVFVFAAMIAAGFAGAAYGPLAAIATGIVGFCAIISAAVALVD